MNKKWRQKSQSPQTGQFNSYIEYRWFICLTMVSLNPLKRVNSILTRAEILTRHFCDGSVSIPSNGSIQFLRQRFQVTVEQRVGRSKKTVIVKRWLRGWGAYFLTLFNWLMDSEIWIGQWFWPKMDLIPLFLVSCPKLTLVWQITVRTSIFILLISLK